MLAAGAQPLHVSRHGRWSDGSRSFAGYVEEATGFGDANPTKGLLLCMPWTAVSSEDLRLGRPGDDSGRQRRLALRYDSGRTGPARPYEPPRKLDVHEHVVIGAA
jgi:hypothetical protein